MKTHSFFVAPSTKTKVAMADARQTPVRARRRAAILSSAERLFTHYGFEKTTVADIAHAAQIGVGSVYLEFDSKETIARGLAEVAHGKVFEAMERAAAASGSFAKRLRGAFDARATHFWDVASAGPHAVDLVLPSTCAGVALEGERFQAREEELFVTLLEAGHQVGELRVEEPADTARVLLRIYATYAPPGLYEQDPNATKRLLDATHDLVVNGLLRRA
jgi:AcrR family transcriptional regulator